MNIFPTIKETTYTAKSAQTARDTVSFAFDFTLGDFVLQNRRPKAISGVDRLCVWIEKLIRTELDKYAVYAGTTYGMNYHNWIHNVRDRDYIRAELSAEVRSKMLENAEITSVFGLSVTFEHHTIYVAYSCATIYGNLESGANEIVYTG